MPLNDRKYELKPASAEEAGLFYAMSPEQDAELGCIGHVRIDFGRHGDQFYHTWHQRGSEELNSKEFKDELTEVVNELRESVLKDFSGMKDFCSNHGGEISGGWTQNYGYIVETENYRYCLRCNPLPGDYQAYLTCFDRRVQEINLVQCEPQETEQGQEPVTEVFYSFLSGKIIDSDGYESPLDGRYLQRYYNREIKEALELDRIADETDMAEFFADDDSIKEKLTSVKWSVESFDGQLFGRIECSLKEALTDSETEVLRNWILGQNADGYGEHFEQTTIDTPEGELYVSFCRNGHDYSVLMRDELDAHLERMDMTMGGM